MLVKDNQGRSASIKISKYLIDWDAKCCSKFQTDVQAFFKRFWYKHVCGVEVRIPRKLLRFDLVNFTKKIIIESNGDQHENFSEFFHQGSRSKFLLQMGRDKEKRQWAELNGFAFVEIYPDDLPNLSLKWFRDKYQLEIT